MRCGPVLIFADETDQIAVAVSEMLSAHLIVPEMLSEAGWSWRSDPRKRTAVIDGGIVGACELAGVITRLAGVFPGHLRHVRYADRDYVAAEMTAFLRAWLTGLPCPVMNEPTSLCLAGPSLRPEQWAVLAHSVGVPHVGCRRTVEPRTGPESAYSAGCCTAIVVDEKVFTPSPVGHRIGDQCRRLARVTQTRLLAAKFDVRHVPARLVDASPWPDITTPDVVAAVSASFSADVNGAAP